MIVWDQTSYETGTTANIRLILTYNWTIEHRYWRTKMRKYSFLKIVLHINDIWLIIIFLPLRSYIKLCIMFLFTIVSKVVHLQPHLDATRSFKIKMVGISSSLRIYRRCGLYDIGTHWVLISGTYCPASVQNFGLPRLDALNIKW